MSFDRYTVAASQFYADADTPLVLWYVIDEDAEEILFTFESAALADAKADELNDNYDEERGMRNTEAAFTRYWEGN